MSKEKKYFEINKALWNEKTKHHIVSSFYDVEGFIAGKTSLKDPELELLGDVRGLSILHLQCHFGLDSLSLARMGAQVVGTDIADKAIAYAVELAHKNDLSAKFVCSDTYSVPKLIQEKFDIVFTSYGVIGWLPDMQLWAQVISKMLKPGGKLVFVEFHPVVWMFDNDFTKIQHSYFNTGPIIETLKGTYANKDADMEMKEIGWNHPMSEVIQSLIDAKLRIEVLKEYDYVEYDCFSNLVQVAENKWQIENMKAKLPLMYALQAVKRT
ncbi:bifunctional 3-demethylubiquinone-9 3-methyltransferase/ 2-octaprenyl-6-hydroxy phenol methylase [Legionella massiliensis]|uniref:Bifunctional 3-demethylubiquinone-9 3-methyltransferase/ 2-octaprenyl-6-hydroxy phenol methylase n=1 Tax=Legionella massiliensis TaxID=1034943 RepID=A0A078KQ19_9GAMM|nr:class I SAM-dependent methyltransferase [Legionella massiliensis]CDZ76460.1 bifunctional 3-demethylubiquinone-9 3-methyltransferase/ 2-octaprenyl-6-hydroxy phenol methylase [Legionella massiliensis]CEE12198.1 Ubiquinone biosynthesis O-methyltransferase [Legionella massiliensis]